MVDTAHYNGIATIREQLRVAGLRTHQRDIVEAAGGDRRMDPRQAFGVDVGRVHPPARPDLGCEHDRQLAVARADIRHRHSRLEREDLPESGPLGSVGAESRSTPRTHAGADEQKYKDDRSEGRGDSEHDSRARRQPRRAIGRVRRIGETGHGYLASN